MISSLSTPDFKWVNWLCFCWFDLHCIFLFPNCLWWLRTGKIFLFSKLFLSHSVNRITWRQLVQPTCETPLIKSISTLHQKGRSLYRRLESHIVSGMCWFDWCESWRMSYHTSLKIFSVHYRNKVVHYNITSYTAIQRLRWYLYRTFQSMGKRHTMTSCGMSVVSIFNDRMYRDYVYGGC